MISKTQLKIRTRRKTNSELEETIVIASKSGSQFWFNVAKLLSGPTRWQSSINLSDIDRKTKAGDTVIIPGKVLSQGELTKKVRICALSISNPAFEKLKETKSEFATIKQEIEKNKKAEGLKIMYTK